jgi:hypothetical protein
MALQTIAVHVNPSDETIRLGPLAVRFLLDAHDFEKRPRRRRFT